MQVEGELWMSVNDRKRLYLIKQVVDGKITQKEASSLIGISTRQVKRICKRFKKEGDGGVLHRNRGRQSNRCIARSIKERILVLCQEKYKGFGPTLASEQLMKNEQIQISDETLRLWLIEKKLPYRKRKERPHRNWRERRKHFGEMLQMDGSHHDWLDGRGPRMVLMGYIDDATGRAFARFYEYEGTIPAFDGLARYIRRNGIPCSVYLDKHSTYKSQRKMTWADHLEGDSGESHFQRGLKELGIEVIHANSPQAKGRIERFFRTLQDRLVKEMGVVAITTLEEANKFLSEYLREHNRKFTVVPINSVNLHRPLGKICLEAALCIRTRRFLRSDFTIFHNGKVYQIESKLRSKYVVVQERIDGTTHVVNGKQELRFHEVDRKTYLGQRKPEVKEGPGKGCHKPATPTANHPWRQFTQKFAENS